MLEQNKTKSLQQIKNEKRKKILADTLRINLLRRKNKLQNNNKP